MPRTYAETNAVIIPVAGVCNVDYTAQKLFDPLLQSLEQHLDVTVLPPYVPPGFGIRQSLRETLADFDAYMAKVEYTYPGIPKGLVGHSLGGLIAHARAINSNPDEYPGSITIAAPLGGIEENHWLVGKDRVREINALAADVLGNGDHLAQLAAQYDTIVPWESALTMIEGSSRYLQRAHCSTESRIARLALTHAGNGIVEHNALLRHPENIRLVTFLAGTMLEKAGVVLPATFSAEQFNPEPFRLAA